MKMKIRKEVSVLIWAMALVVAGGMGLISMGCGCGGDNEGGKPPEIVFVYPSPTNPPEGDKPTGIPLKDATDVPLNAMIIGTSSDTNKLLLDLETFTMTVNDGTSDVPGRIEISFDQSSVLFIPDVYLKEGSIHTITVSQASPKYGTTISFSTVASAGTFAGEAGKGLALKIPSGSVTQPPGIGGIVEPFLSDINIVLATTDVQPVDADTGFVQITGGEGNEAQTKLSAGSFVLPLSGSYKGEYVKMVGVLSLDIEGFILTIDSFNISGKVTDFSEYGITGIGITEGTLAAIATCSELTPDIKAVVQQFCTETGYLILVGSFYASPFAVTEVTDLLGKTLTMSVITEPATATGVPVGTKVSVDLLNQNGEYACITVGSTSTSVTLRDFVDGTLVAGDILTVPSTIVPFSGCTATELKGNGQITQMTFTPKSNLAASHDYKALTILDLTPVTGTTFKTQ